MLSTNEKVNAFLIDIQSTLPDDYEIVEKIRAVFLKEYPQIDEEIKYGGITFNASGELIGGVFISKKHISIEFSNGAQFTDTDKLLEGKGKFRRHLKILNSDDLENKKFDFYIKQAGKAT
jgi:hypothetical protein